MLSYSVRDQSAPLGVLITGVSQGPGYAKVRCVVVV